MNRRHLLALLAASAPLLPAGNIIKTQAVGPTTLSMPQMRSFALQATEPGIFLLHHGKMMPLDPFRFYEFPVI